MPLLPLRRAPLAAALALGLASTAFAASTPAAAGAANAASDAGASATSGAEANAAPPKELEKVQVIGVRAPSSTSPKYTQPLIDTPQTLTIIPSQVYEAQAQTTLRDALRNTPGITVQAGEGGGAPGDNVYVRGFTARNDISIDGVRDPGVVSRDLFNVEQI